MALLWLEGGHKMAFCLQSCLLVTLVFIPVGPHLPLEFPACPRGDLVRDLAGYLGPVAASFAALRPCLLATGSNFLPRQTHACVHTNWVLILGIWVAFLFCGSRAGVPLGQTERPPYSSLCPSLSWTPSRAEHTHVCIGLMWHSFLPAQF